MQTQHLGQAWSAALRTGHIEAFIDLYHPHALLETPFGRCHGRDEIEAFLGALPWRKLRDHTVVASRTQDDHIAVVAQHGATLVEHVLQVVDNQIRAHRVEVRQ